MRAGQSKQWMPRFFYYSGKSSPFAWHHLLLSDNHLKADEMLLASTQGFRL
jgi:hypothetical protein